MLGLGLCLWFTFGLVSLAEDWFRSYRKPFVLFGRRRSSSPVSSSEKLKVIGETRSYNPTLLQPELRGRMGEGPQQRGWGGRVCSYPATKPALSLDMAFFPSSLHWSQCVPPALASWLYYLHPTWSLRGEEGQPGNRGRQKTSEGPGLEPQGPIPDIGQRGTEKPGEHQGREQPTSVKDKLTSISSPDLPPLELKSHNEVWSQLFSTLQFLCKHLREA